MEFFFILLLIAGAIIWFIAVRSLMACGDDEFTGQYDKLAWAVILAFSGPLGALVYLFRRQNLEEDQEELRCPECGATIPEGQDQCPVCGWTYLEK